MPTCKYCKYSYPIDSLHCPHCARPGLFPNVAMAELVREQRALEQRYLKAIDDAASRGCINEVRDFQKRIASSKAVIARDAEKTIQLADEYSIYSTYHQMIETENRIAEGTKWDKIRDLSGSALFGWRYMKEVRFGALSLDGIGITNYGECSWVLRDDMISHRASVFEENSAMFMLTRGITMAQASELPAGHRATWQDRGKLCVAKLAKHIYPGYAPQEYAQILMTPGSNTEEDNFVEVHISGPLTVFSLERVIFRQGSRRDEIQDILKAKLKKFNIDLKVV